MRLLYTLLTVLIMGTVSAQSYYVIPSAEGNGEVFGLTMTTPNDNGGILLDINDERFVVLDDAVADDLRTATLSSTVSIPVLTVRIPSNAFSTERYFGYPCTPTTINAITPNGDDCGGGVTITNLDFTFTESGIYYFDWDIDAEDERTSPIVVYANGTIVVHPYTQR